MKLRAALLVVLAATGLQGCEREPAKTTVVPPHASLPDAAVLKPGVVAAVPPAAPPPVPAPVVPAPVAPEAQASAPAPAPAAPPAQEPETVANPGDTEGAQLLAKRTLRVPVVGVAPTRLADNYEQGRAGHVHEAIDIMAPAGTQVVAVDDGRVVKLFTSREGGLTVYQYDREGTLAYYYAHLQAYAPGLREGRELKRGDAIGTVGSTGNANPNAPHLHFGVFRLGTPARWWEGQAVNPYPALRRAEPPAIVTASR
jgi:murein DD-endopeptidase MepM/ murein hydrolase activator NlpD